MSDHYTDADVQRAVDAIEKHREWSENWASDTALCIATDVLPVVARAIAARALREAAETWGLGMSATDQWRGSTVAAELRDRADEIEAS